MIAFCVSKATNTNKEETLGRSLVISARKSQGLRNIHWQESAMSENKSKEWALEPETEYRFELDPGTSLAIKVCPPIFVTL